ncbi:MAG TPA: PilZ domain-containing protein [Terriglobales bacterium]|nr:PilZ domain-containing protein [Terriglobales bacterium]
METQAESQGGPQLLVRIWGMNAEGRPFFQNVMARNLTSESALLSGIEHALKTEEVIGVQHEDKKARFRVLRVKDAGLPQRILAEVQLMPGQQCPWPAEAAAAPKVPGRAAPSGSNKRQYPRFKVRFPLELRDERGGGAHMQTSASDISGRGCYVESLTPLPLGTHLSVTFWLNQEKVVTNGVIRASDPGVGMGIEFTGLDETGQERLQRYLEMFQAAAGSSS